MALQAAVLAEVQMKQDRERDKMADLINEATTLQTIQTWISGLKADVRYGIVFVFMMDNCELYFINI